VSAWASLSAAAGRWAGRWRRVEDRRFDLGEFETSESAAIWPYLFIVSAAPVSCRLISGVAFVSFISFLNCQFPGLPGTVIAYDLSWLMILGSC
jgi:hypothetical protein